MFDRQTGAVNPEVVAYWRDNYDIGHRIETEWPRLERDLDGKVHVTVGAVDSYYLDGAVRRLEGRVPESRRAGPTSLMCQTHRTARPRSMPRGEDRNALWKDMTSAMYAMARLGKGGPTMNGRRDRRTRARERVWRFTAPGEI